MSTTDAILQCTEYVRTEMDKKNTVCGAFLDLSKAFDSISYEILIEKLKSLGFDRTSTHLIRSYLKDRTQKEFSREMSPTGFYLTEVYHKGQY